MKKLFLIKTDTTIKGEQARRYWIERNIIENFYTTAEDTKQAFLNYCKHINEGYVARISKNAEKTKQAIFRDINSEAVQVGYIITALTEIEGKNIFCDLWCEVFQIAEFEEGAKCQN